MKSVRDLWWKDIRIAKLEVQTTGDFHSILTTEELALASGIGAEAVAAALVQILEAKGK